MERKEEGRRRKQGRRIVRKEGKSIESYIGRKGGRQAKKRGRSEDGR